MSSTSYPADAGDWRGLFIRHLVDALARRDDVALRLWAPPGELPANVRYAASPAERAWLADLARRGGIAHVLRAGGLARWTAPARLLLQLRDAYSRAHPALYHVNWLQNAIPLPRDGRPCVVSVLGTDLRLLRLPLVTTLLRRAFRHRSVVVCPNAEWMVPVLARAFGDLAEIRFVPFGIDPMWFGVRRDAPTAGPQVWLCVSRVTRPKIGPLFEATADLFREGERELHLFGPMQEEMVLPPWVRYHGPASPASLCDEWFPKAHGLVSLSRHAEGRPQVMLEAMAAGLPVVASRLPAHEDLLEHGETGWLCDTPADVATAFAALADPATNRRTGAAARAWAASGTGTWDDCAERYAHVYRAMLEGSEA